jgi:hypothetical protein
VINHRPIVNIRVYFVIYVIGLENDPRYFKSVVAENICSCLLEEALDKRGQNLELFEL